MLYEIEQNYAPALVLRQNKNLTYLLSRDLMISPQFAEKVHISYLFNLDF